MCLMTEGNKDSFPTDFQFLYQCLISEETYQPEGSV